MKQTKTSIHFSASDLVNYLGCKHLTELDRQHASGIIDAPDWQNPALAFIQQKGIEHEKAYDDMRLNHFHHQPFLKYLLSQHNHL